MIMENSFNFGSIWIWSDVSSFIGHRTGLGKGPLIEEGPSFPPPPCCCFYLALDKSWSVWCQIVPICEKEEGG